MKELVSITLLITLFIVSSCSKEDDTPSYPTPTQQEMLDMFQGEYASVAFGIKSTIIEFDPPFEKPQIMIWSLGGLDREVEIHGTYTIHYWIDPDLKYHLAYSLEKNWLGYNEYSYEGNKLSSQRKCSIVIGKDGKRFTWYRGDYSPSLMIKQE